MADQLLLLQDAVNVQAESICNSIGVTQSTAKERPFLKSESTVKIELLEDYCKTFSLLIASTARDIDNLINTLPSDDITQDYKEEFIQLDKETKEAAVKLAKVVCAGETLLEHIQKVRQNIIQSQLIAEKLNIN